MWGEWGGCTMISLLIDWPIFDFHSRQAKASRRWLRSVLWGRSCGCGIGVPKGHAVTWQGVDSLTS